MMKHFVFFLIVFTQNLFALEAELELNPSAPVKGNEYEIIFKVKGDFNESPFISFNPSGTEIIEKSNESISIKSTLVNGRLKTEREMRISYRAISENSGTARLSDIKIEVGGETKRLENYSYKILDQEEKAKDIFVQAELSKTDLFLGEGVEVNFYLYSKRPILSQEIKRFPQLNKFLKRFRNIQPNEEVYRIGNDIYRKIHIYSSRLFPQNETGVMVDPITLTVQYQAGGYSPFGGLGFQIQQPKSRDVSSKLIKLNVSKLPAENVPPNFTGMVGAHEIQFKMSRNKFITNDVIEMTLEVVGDGALENMVAPKLLVGELIEEFEVKSDITELPGGRAKKVFNYTFIARKEGTIDPRTVEVSFFSPQTTAYYSKTIEIPSLEIVGQANSGVAGTPPQPQGNDIGRKVPLPKKAHELLAPYYEPSNYESFIWSRKYQFFALLFLLLCLSIIYVKQNYLVVDRNNEDALTIIKNLKNQTIDFELLYRLTEIISKESTNTQIRGRIESSRLSESSKRELKEIVNASEAIYKGQGNNLRPPRPSKKLINEIKNLAK